MPCSLTSRKYSLRRQNWVMKLATGQGKVLWSSLPSCHWLNISSSCTYWTLSFKLFHLSCLSEKITLTFALYYIVNALSSFPWQYYISKCCLNELTSPEPVRTELCQYIMWGQSKTSNANAINPPTLSNFVTLEAWVPFSDFSPSTLTT